MGLSRLDAMIIQSHPDANLLISAAGPQGLSGKWAGWLFLLRDGLIHRPIVNTLPVYNSQEDAKAAMVALVKEIRDMGDDIFKDSAAQAAEGGGKTMSERTKVLSTRLREAKQHVVALEREVELSRQNDAKAMALYERSPIRTGMKPQEAAEENK